MTLSLRYVAFALGLAAILWVGAAYVGTNAPALGLTILIGVFYLMGGWELARFQQATASLSGALTALTGPPASLPNWLMRLHPSLQNAVRLRIEGERVGLPGPSMTPYLAGLLVLLGMLGTFLGMVVTLNGTGAALESASDMQAIRASLAAPVKGLGLAFGTSLAGVAASAMLGLVSALCRRDRLQAGQLLDSRIATALRVFSATHQREQSLKLLEQQSQSMPALVDRLRAMLDAIERQNQTLNDRLVSNQETFHGRAEAAYDRLALSVGQSLTESLTESARIAGSAVQPVVEATMAAISREATALHDALRDGAQQQAEGLARRLDASTTTVAGLWKEALDVHQRTSEAMSASLQASLGDAVAQFDRRSDRWLRSVDAAHLASQAATDAREQQRLADWTGTLHAMATSLAHEWQQAGAAAAVRHQEVCRTLETTAHDLTAQAESHARHTIAEIARLVKAASDAPRAAAEVVAELRAKVSDSIARDNTMLEERHRLLETLGAVLDGVNQASNEQRGAVDALVASSADVLERVASRFAEQVEGESGRIVAASAQVAGSAVEVASLGEAFGVAVQSFSDSNDRMAAHLQRIESALGKTAVRSDEQLAYYVAQAREVVDLSVMSQRQIMEELQQLARRRAPEASEA